MQNKTETHTNGSIKEKQNINNLTNKEQQTNCDTLTHTYKYVCSKMCGNFFI